MTVEPWLAQARRLLDEHAHRIILSTQVLAEFYLRHGQTFARLRVVNPFRADAADRVT